MKEGVHVALIGVGLSKGYKKLTYIKAVILSEASGSLIARGAVDGPEAGSYPL